MEGSENTSGVNVGMAGGGVDEGRVGWGVGAPGVSINEIVGRSMGVAVPIALCVSASAVPTVEMAVFRMSS